MHDQFLIIGTENLAELISAIMQRIGLDTDTEKIQLLVRLHSCCFVADMVILPEFGF